MFLQIKICVRIYTVSDVDRTLSARYEWTHPSYATQPAPNVARAFPWALSRLQRSLSVSVSSLRELPPEATDVLRWMQQQGYAAMLVLPMVSGHRGLGAIAFGSTYERSWPDAS